MCDMYVWYLVMLYDIKTIREKNYMWHVIDLWYQCAASLQSQAVTKYCTWFKGGQKQPGKQIKTVGPCYQQTTLPACPTLPAKPSCNKILDLIQSWPKTTREANKNCRTLQSTDNTSSMSNLLQTAKDPSNSPTKFHKTNLANSKLCQSPQVLTKNTPWDFRAFKVSKIFRWKLWHRCTPPKRAQLRSRESSEKRR